MAGSTLTSSLVVRLIDQVTAPARTIGRSLLGLERAASGGNMGEQLAVAMERNQAALANARGGLVDAVAGFYALKGALGAPIGAAIKFESALADVAKVTSFDDAGLKAYGDQLRRLAVTEIPLAVDELAKMSAAAAQAGVPEAELLDFTRTVAKAAVAWDMNATSAGEALAKIRSGLRLSNAEVGSFADAINHLSDRTASSAPDLIDFSGRVSAVGETYGFAKEEALAFGAAMISANNTPEVSATSFRNMGRALTKGTSATKRQSAAFAKLGLDATKVAKAMQRDAVGTTLKVIDKLSQIPDYAQAAVISDLFGDEAQALAPLIGKVDILRDALKHTADEQAYLNSVNKEFEKRSATSEYRLQRFKSQLNDIALTVGASLLPALNGIIGPLGEIALKFAAFAEANPEFVRNVILATGAVIGFKVAIAGLKFVGLLGRGGALSMLALGYNTVGKAAIGATKAMRNAVGLQASLAAMGGMKMTGFQTMATALRGMAMAVPGVSAIGAALTAVGAALATVTAPVWGLVAAAVAAVAAAGFMLYKYWDRVSAVLSGVGRAIGEQLAPALEYARPVIDAFSAAGSAIATGWDSAVQAVKAFGEWIASFFQQEVLSDADKAKWESAGHDVATKMIESIKAVVGGLVDWFTFLPRKIIAAIGSIDIGSLIKWPSPPAWLSRLWGGGTIDVPAPANNNEPVSGHRKNGGPIWPGGSFLVGEDGPEIVSPKTGSRVTPLGQAGGGVTLNFNGGINITGSADPKETKRVVVETIRDEIREAMRSSYADMGAR
jgi:TP901 family phage tail tape measure protein